jgi:tetratricopeptide (TPR) repeat protein
VLQLLQLLPNGKLMTRRLVFVLVTLFCISVLVSSDVPASAKDTWTSVRSKNFLLVGNANEKDIRRVGVRLEQFREVFSRLFTTLNVNSPVPTTVIVFKDDDSYLPFKPNKNTAGYFQSGHDVNYITLKLVKELHSEQDPFTIIFHEYTHLMVQNTSGHVPAWFNEGLAEYYSTCSITDDQKVVMGRPIASHIFLLRENKMLPLRTLFQVDQQSSYYNESDKQSIFYAESWALMHYLIHGNNGQRVTQMANFLKLLSAGVPTEQAFQQAFAMSFESMEKELRAYIQRDRYSITTGSFQSKVAYDTAMQSTPITEAEAQAYLGDLLLHSHRSESEAYLQKALALNPDLSMANASLGMLRVRQGKTNEAIKSLERAVAASPQNYLIHYYYAFALSREGNLDMQSVLGFAPETAAKMRTELKHAIQLRPDFPESYSLLAFVNLVTETDLDETLALLKRAIASSPGRNDLVFMLAQLYTRKEDFKTARELIDKLSGENNDAEMRKRARGLLAQLVSLEELASIRRQKEERALNSRNGRGMSDSLATSAQTTAVESYDPAAQLRDSLRRPAADEKQAQGTLARIDCDAKSIVFIIKINGRLSKLSTDSFSHMELMSFSADAGQQVTCGLRKPENNVVVCYLPATEARAKTDGVIKSIEFVPPDFTLKPSP